MRRTATAAAIQAKLDELIRAVGHARNEFIGIEHLTEKELEEIRQALEKAGGDESSAARRDRPADRAALARSRCSLNDDFGAHAHQFVAEMAAMDLVAAARRDQLDGRGGVAGQARSRLREPSL